MAMAELAVGRTALMVTAAPTIYLLAFVELSAYINVGINCVCGEKSSSLNHAGIQNKYYCVYDCILYVQYLSKKT